MFFRFIRQSDTTHSKWLFFHRNRISVDYRMTTKAYSPVFGSTEAISWNHPALKGLAPVFPLQILQGGINPKSGIQYARSAKNLTLFSWLVAGLTAQADHDFFLLLRFTPTIGKSLKLFSQFESVNTIAKRTTRFHSFTQRIRIGISRKHWQTGLGTDLQQTGRKHYQLRSNTGIFLRHEF